MPLKTLKILPMVLPPSHLQIFNRAWMSLVHTASPLNTSSHHHTTTCFCHLQLPFLYMYDDNTFTFSKYDLLTFIFLVPINNYILHLYVDITYANIINMYTPTKNIKLATIQEITTSLSVIVFNVKHCKLDMPTYGMDIQGWTS